MSVSIPYVPKRLRSDIVDRLLDACQEFKDENQKLKDEIARLKGYSTRPVIQPSRLTKKKKKKGGKRPGSAKRKKTAELEIHESVEVPPAEPLPQNSRFKGYRDYTVIGLRFEPHNIRYRLEVWQSPDGKYLSGALPQGSRAFDTGHFSPSLCSYILHQHHGALVPQHVIVEQLQDLGISISAGQVHRILVELADDFHAEKDALLKVGLKVSPHIQVDDTGARHQGRNGVCTHIGNAWFASFSSTSSKSRINFLELLRAGGRDYVLNDAAFEYMAQQKLPKDTLEKLRQYEHQAFADASAWASVLEALDISERSIKTATEGALLGSVLTNDIHPELSIMSDDAGQFNILRHGLCWVHAERLLGKLLGFSEYRNTLVMLKRREIWRFYRRLKAYKRTPSKGRRRVLNKDFDTIFTEKTEFVCLNLALKRLHKNKDELLLVLEKPGFPLHNNLSENDIREYVTRRKRNGPTRSEQGRRCRDTFTSLKKTCRKHGISFWKFLLDRCSGAKIIEPLPNWIERAAKEQMALATAF